MSFDARTFQPVVNAFAKNGVLAKHVSQLLDRTQYDPFASALLEISLKANSSLLIARELLDLEFARKIGGEENSILRENSLCTRFITLYTAKTCKTYLRKLLAPLFANNQAEATEDAYARVVQDLFARMRNPEMIDSIPRPVRAIAAMIAELAFRYCPERKFPLMAGFLFLRLINPALAAPQTVRNANEPPLPPPVRQTCLMMSKVLQHLSNNTKLQQYPTLTKWVESSQPDLEEFLDEVITDDDEEGSEAVLPFAEQLSLPPRSVNASEIDVQVLVDFYHVLCDQSKNLDNVRGRLLDANNAPLVTLYTDLLRALELTKCDIAPSWLAPTNKEPSQSTSAPQLARPASTQPSPPTPHAANTVSPSSGLNTSGNYVPTVSAVSTSSAASANGHHRQKSSSDVNAYKREGSGLKDKMMKLLNTGSSSSSQKQSSQQQSQSTMDELLSRIDCDDCSSCSNLTILLLLRAMLGKGGMARPKEFVFCVREAASWIEENLNLPHRGGAIMLLRTLEDKCVILPLDPPPSEGKRVADDASIYEVDAVRFRIWDALVGKNSLPELDDCVTLCRGLCEQYLQGETDEDILGRVAAHMTSHLKRAFEREGGMWPLHFLQEWLVLFAEITYAQSVNLIRDMVADRVIIAGEFRDSMSEDAALLLSCIQTAFGIGFGVARRWDRPSLVQLLIGSSEGKAVLESLDVDLYRKDFGLGGGLSRCRIEDFHGLLQQQFKGKGRHNSAEYWFDLWRRLEEADMLRCRRVVKIDTNNQYIEQGFWYLTTAGTDFLIERQSAVPLWFGQEEYSPESSLTSSEGSLDFMTKFFSRRNTQKMVGRRSVDMDSESSDSASIDSAEISRRSPRSGGSVGAKLTRTGSKKVSPMVLTRGKSSGMEKREVTRSGDFKAYVSELQKDNTSSSSANSSNGLSGSSTGVQRISPRSDARPAETSSPAALSGRPKSALSNIVGSRSRTNSDDKGRERQRSGSTSKE